MKVLEISGKLYVMSNLTHHEILNILYQELKQKHDIHFAGITKDVTKEYKESKKYIEES